MIAISKEQDSNAFAQVLTEEEDAKIPSIMASVFHVSLILS